MIQIRQAKESDLEQLARLFDLYRIFYRKQSDLNAANFFLKERLHKNESVIFVAEENESLIGFTQLYPQFSSTRMMRTWLLNDLYVLNEYRGRGISKQLIDAAKQLAKQTDAAGLLLETEKTNMVGNRLYPSAGFVLYSETNFYWWENK
ncbi:MAG: GNAT family N-acetyltransferase [Chitinophagaceae bacterium]|nr:GNAT family N-acetyltransferase [Chitinophagaceae bacterium]